MKKEERIKLNYVTSAPVMTPTVIAAAVLPAFAQSPSGGAVIAGVDNSPRAEKEEGKWNV